MTTANAKRTNKKHKADAVPAKFAPGFIKMLDGRTELAKGLKERFDSIAADQGGVGELSHIKATLLERFVWLEASVVAMEATLLDGKVDAKTHAELLARWIQACNALTGIAKILGVEKKYHGAPWLEPAT